jgi:AcrR family transcriptional regulator
MREVARKSGVSHQAPYYYFGDREAILAAIAAEGFSTLGQSFLRAVDQTGCDPAKALEAIGHAYVGFALRHPAYFQAMFRADAVPLDRYPDVRKLSDEAFGKLVETIGKLFADQPSAARLRISIACWAMVHGLATLILEGTLARSIEIPRARQRRVADEVIATFTSLFIKDRM